MIREVQPARLRDAYAIVPAALFGAAILVGSIGYTWRAYRDAERPLKRAVVACDPTLISGERACRYGITGVNENAFHAQPFRSFDIQDGRGGSIAMFALAASEPR